MAKGFGPFGRLRTGLRTRVAANLAAAVSVTFGLLALSTMAVLRTSLVRQEQAAASRLTTTFVDALHACAGGDEPCVDDVVGRAAAVGVTLEIRDDPGCAPCEYAVRRSTEGTAPALVVERPFRHGHVQARHPLTPVAERVTNASKSLVLWLLLNAFALVVVGVVLFERGVVRRLERLGEAVAKVERLELEPPLLPGEGDEIGRMGGAVRRMVERLRDERLRTEAYIEELERSNRSLREAQEHLARSDRLATVGRLSAGVAHEIGNPLAAIIGYLDLLKRRPNAPREEFLDRIDREAQRIDRILRDLLDFARPQPLKVEPVSLASVVENASRLVTPQPRWRRMSLESSLPNGLPVVLANEHHLTQVLVNLLMNAADACNGEGLVRIDARLDARLEADGGRGDQPGDRPGDGSDEYGRVVLEIRDDGPGIPPADLGRIFDPFFTTKPPGEGTGLGLALCHRLMETFGGDIRATNAEPHGAVFTLRFRVATSPQATSAGH